MIPQKKKTLEEMAALREGLGILPAATAPAPLPPSPAPIPEAFAKREEAQPEAQPEPVATAADLNGEPVIHLEPPPVPSRRRQMEIKPSHSLRKHELPLAPATASRNRTELPTRRHDARDVAQIQKREALAAIQLKQGADPAAHLRKQTASPFLYAPGYLLAFAAAVTAYQGAKYITPAALMGLATVIMVFIAWQKPRSRHHAALLFIVIFLTLVFGALHYAPLFQNGP